MSISYVFVVLGLCLPGESLLNRFKWYQSQWLVLVPTQTSVVWSLYRNS